MQFPWVAGVIAALLLAGLGLFAPRGGPGPARYGAWGAALVAVALAAGLPGLGRWTLWPHALAVVTRLTHAGGGSRTVVPVFRFTARGAVTEAVGTLPEYPSRYHVGQGTVVAWDPGDPSRVIPRDDRFVPFGYTGAPGVLLLGLAGVGLRRRVRGAHRA